LAFFLLIGPALQNNKNVLFALFIYLFF